MSGGGGRSKSKKQRNAVFSEDEQNLVLREIHQKSEVGGEDILRLYRIIIPPCQDCRLNTKDAPNCWCALIPPPGGAKKRGMWRKVSEIEMEFGCDPAEVVRSSLSSPAGLTNLGATCYVNSVLQCLYRIRPFMEGLFAAESDLIKRQFVLREVAVLFGQLHSGRRKAVDSAPLATILELNNSIQQDGQEFLKLLLTSLEGLLGLSKNPRVCNVIKDVFRGTLSHVTRCSKCGRESTASNQIVDFYELELNVKGLGSLVDSLNDYLSVEQLLGDNQFFCESCNTRVDATHCCKLRSLPPVLNFQLKRFVFDAKTATKKKVTSKFTFPQTLDMSSRLSPIETNEAQQGGRAPLLYDLSAILIHKGSLANCGHYVANIKDECSGEWWEYDDELVTSLGSHPFGSESEIKTKGANCGALPGVEMKELDEGPDAQTTLTSADAYMLIYNLRRGHSDHIIENSGGENLTNPEMCPKASEIHLPEYLRFEIEEHNAELKDRCEKYKRELEGTLSNITSRKHEIMSVLQEAPVTRLEDGFFWISSSWLRTWIDDLLPPPIDNSELRCQHDKVPPMKVNAMKCISEKAWLGLQAKYGGGPLLSAGDCCIDCIREMAKAVDTASSFRDERNKVKQMLDDEIASNSLLEGDRYFVSRSWLQSWLRRKSGDAPVESDGTPTAAITCPHDGLLPDSAPGAKRQSVPREIWNFFLRVALEVGDKLPNSCLSFPIDTPTCCVCEEEMTQVASQEQDLRAIKKEQRQKHGLLFSGESIVLFPGVTYNLVPSAWLVQWRSYLGESRRKTLKSDEPIGLEGSLHSLLCEKHKALLYRTPKLHKNRRGELLQENDEDDTFTIVSEDDWTDLCEQWNVNPLQSITAVVDPSTQCRLENNQEDTPLDGVCEALADESSIPRLHTKPEVCKECVPERECAELRRKLQYFDEDICVDLVHGKEPPKAVLESSKGERRVSKRPRRGTSSSNKRTIFKVSGCTTLHQLKMMIWESFDVVKENQRIHFGAMELLDDSATMAELNILPRSHLWVVDTGLHENRDIAEDLNIEAAKTAVTEEGFSGTLLARLPGLAGSFFLERSNGLHRPCDYDVMLHLAE